MLAAALESIGADIGKVLGYYTVDSLSDLTESEEAAVMRKVERKRAKDAEAHLDEGGSLLS